MSESRKYKSDPVHKLRENVSLQEYGCSPFPSGFPSDYEGFAFGIGLERIVMRKYNIDDMRLLYENDLKFFKSIY